ncbi:MAG TPA: CopG family antitoxin [Desulfatiglandales bacterium]|nr:CopG family antitoxin [Desulfatiglandales bacterium]
MEKGMKIPEFKTIEEMARFWNTHDITDFENHLIEVKEPLFENMESRIILLMLDSEQYDKLKKIADQKKLNTISLVNEWVTKQIEDESNQLLR